MKREIKFLIAMVIGMMIISKSEAQTKWTLDNAHTGVKFTVTHLVISEIEGAFKSFTGSMTATKPDFSDAQIDFSVDIASINTDNEMRDTHLGHQLQSLKQCRLTFFSRVFTRQYTTCP